LRLVDPETMAAATDAHPKRLAVPDHDQFSPPARAVALTADWPAASVVTLPDSDHFLVGRASAVVDAVVAWLPSVLGGG
jgi:alpha/beta superfamily hydrolase